MEDVLLPSVAAVMILDEDGGRLFSKYYTQDRSSAPVAEQKAFELSVHKKTKGSTARTEADILLVDAQIAVFRSGNDTKFYVVGCAEENELILSGVLDTIYDTISTLLRSQLDRRTILDNLELVMLTVDEVIDHGQVLELDASAVANRVLMRGVEGGQIPIGDMSIGQAFGIAKEQIMKSLNRDT